MTPSAIRKIFAERGLVVVTAGTAHFRFRRVVHYHRRDIHFAAGCRVTVIAFEKAVFRVAEIAGDK